MKTLAIMLVAGFALVSCSSHKDSRKVPHKDYYYDQQVKSMKKHLEKNRERQRAARSARIKEIMADPQYQ